MDCEKKHYQKTRNSKDPAATKEWQCCDVLLGKPALNNACAFGWYPPCRKKISRSVGLADDRSSGGKFSREGGSRFVCLNQRAEPPLRFVITARARDWVLKTVVMCSPKPRQGGRNSI